MGQITCKSCGGTVTRKGNYYVCDFCRSKWMIDVGDDVHAVERVNAWESLREGDFEKATERFEAIVTKDPKDYEGYWGRALALNGILYVDDVREGKKVPTCNNITENPFLKDKDVQKAISLAPQEIKENYQSQAEQIEKIRVEWLNVASKEPPYDVFISFKDSDRERGIERTQDSIDAQDIYTGLVDAGYKVFYSRVSLRGKVSEQYEPYIYNAIKTAKVMIVFGEKPEYFSSTWIKNEWSRFRARIEKGEKHKNSLVVVVKDMNPSDLPVALKSRQAMNMSDLTFFETLKKHIKRVVDESNQAVRLDKIEIQGGQIAKKAQTLTTNTLQTREIGMGATAQTDITEVQTLSLVDTYIDARQWGDAAKLLEDVLFNNPSCMDALWKQIWVEKRIKGVFDLTKKMETFTERDLQRIDQIINCSTREKAAEILDLLYTSSCYAQDETHCKILQAILPYQYDDRAVKLQEAFDHAIKKTQENTFQLLLSTLSAEDVDTYIDYNQRYAQGTQEPAEAKRAAERILAVDEGNLVAWRMLLRCQLSMNEYSTEVIKTLRNVLKYTDNNRVEIQAVLSWLGENLNSLDDCALIKEVLRYSTDDISTWKTELLSLSRKMIEQRFFEDAEYLSKLILAFNATEPDVYWNLCLIKAQAVSEEKILESDIPLKEVPEYTKYLTLVGEERRKGCIKLVSRQMDLINSRKKHAMDDVITWKNRDFQSLKYQIERTDDKKKELKASRKRFNALLIFLTLVAVSLFIFAIWHAKLLKAEYGTREYRTCIGLLIGSISAYAVFSVICACFNKKLSDFDKLLALSDAIGKEYETANCLHFMVLFAWIFIILAYATIGWVFAFVGLIRKKQKIVTQRDIRACDEEKAKLNALLDDTRKELTRLLNEKKEFTRLLNEKSGQE